MQPLYSLALAKFLPPDALEAVRLCNRPDAKVLYLGADASAPPLKKTWKETMAELDRAVQRFKIKIARLAEDSEMQLSHGQETND